MINRTKYLFLIQFDYEYQSINNSTIKQNLTKRQVSDYYMLIKHSILLCDEGVFIVPAFIAESELTKQVMLLYPDLLYSQYLFFVMNETDHKDYLLSREEKYKKNLSYYNKYTDEKFRNIIINSNNRIVEKRSSTEYINTNWKLLFLNSDISNKNLFMKIPELIKGSAFIWQNVNKIIKTESSAVAQFNKSIRRHLLKLYIESNVKKNDISVISNWKYDNTNLSLKNNNLYNMFLFEEVLKICELKNEIDRLDILAIEDLKNSSEFIQFKEYYFGILSTNTYQAVRQKFAEMTIKADNLIISFKERVTSLIRNIERNHYEINRRIDTMNVKGLETIMHEHETNGVVIFIDIIGYSKEYQKKQVTMFKKMSKHLRETLSTFTKEKIFAVSTGDGYLIVVQESKKYQVGIEIIQEYYKALDDDLCGLHLRVGIHCGSFTVFELSNGTLNAIGHSINMASRVMGIGNKNHVLLSKTYFDYALANTKYAAHAKDIGEYKIKHGEKLHVYSFYLLGIGSQGGISPLL